METVGGYESQFPRPLSESLILCRFCADKIWKRLDIKTYGVDVVLGYRISKGIFMCFDELIQYCYFQMFCYKSL
jgi:hypothetical protein